jgi:hypothetical protein
VKLGLLARELFSMSDDESVFHDPRRYGASLTSGALRQHFKIAEEAMRKAEEVAFHAIGSGPY